MAIVLEGPDNSGKSTLAKELSELTGWPIVHGGGPGDPKDIEERLVKDIGNMQRDIIMDRSVIISDTIYSNRIRGGRIFDPRYWFRMMQAVTQHSDTLILFCTAETKVLTDMTHHIVKPHETEEHVKQVLANKLELVEDYHMMYNVISMFIDCSMVDPREQPNLAMDIVTNMSIAKEEEIEENEVEH